MSDLVNHPAHYEEQSIRLEPIDFCERLPFCEGNAIKYCFRAGHKEGTSELLDLKKAQWYLNRRSSEDALEMNDRDYASFLNMTRLFKRSSGILKDFINKWNNLTAFDGDFWSCLEGCITERIKKLEARESLNRFTTGSKE